MKRDSVFDTHFDVAISFAGEDRAVALDLAQRLRLHGLQVFCDRTELERLWGSNLVDALAEVFGSRSTCCIVLVSRYYVAKEWPDFERQHILARALREPGDFLLPVQLDSTRLPGLPPSILSLDLASSPLAEIAALVVRKLAARPGASGRSFTAPPPAGPGDLDFQQGFSLFRLGSFDQAAARFKRCLDLDPANAEAHYYLVLAVVSDSRPKLMSAETVRKVERHLEDALRRSAAGKYRLALALVKHDYYVLNGLDPLPPTVDELLTPPPTLGRKDLADLTRCFLASEPGILQRASLLEDGES
jgi:hypothetical protein